MRTIIIDDEAPGRKILRRLLEAHPDVKVVGEAASVEEALRLVRAEAPQLLFLDIQLRGETGFDLLAVLPDPPPQVVFVTAWDQHAVRAFELDALDYLLKPVEPERLALTIRRIREAASRSPDGDLAAERVLVKSEREHRWLFWRDILAIQAEGNYTRLKLRGGDQLLVYRTLKAWAEQRPGMFVQVHRKHLVQSGAIERVATDRGGSRSLVLVSGDTIEVGPRFWPLVKNSLIGPEKGPFRHKRSPS